MWLTGNLKIWLYPKPIDMRKSIDGLSIVVADNMNLNPINSEIFVFYNRAGDKIKILYWDKNGFCLWYKRLEKSRFKIPATGETKYNITSEQLRWLLDGLDIGQMTPIEILHYQEVY